MASLRFRGRDRRRQKTLLLVALGALAGVAVAAAITGDVRRRRRRRRNRTSEEAVSRLVDSAPDAPHDAHEDPSEHHHEDLSDPHHHDVLEHIHEMERDTGVPVGRLAPDDEELEDRVLEAFHNDPTLRGRAIDIGAIGDGIIELTGWVNSAAEVGYAITLARGVPDVAHVMDSLTIRNPEHSRRRPSADE